ncbi:MAG TPA: hypothetical protein VEI07_25005 [Planctomycetaceae bacterium]|nr:hypothetical protein [Planctomycetaceae bacterium]
MSKNLRAVPNQEAYDPVNQPAMLLLCRAVRRIDALQERLAMNDSMLSALRAAGPSAELTNDDRLYDPLIGSWNVRAVDYLDDGSRRVNTGEWHFAYVLEGRAVQDVWISPPRSDRHADMPKECNRYGTTLRFFHPARKRWELTWTNPVSGARNVLVARRDGNDIVQEGRADEGDWMRWVFTEISKNSARWYGETSIDGGKTWKLGAEFSLTRQGNGPEV